LRGDLTITLNRDGSYRFSGFMKATGFPSFSYRVAAVIRSATKQVTVAAQHSGKVFGTDTPGDRQDNWDESGTDPSQMKLIRNVWPDISAGGMRVSTAWDLTGLLGGAVGLVKDLAKFFVVAETLGPGLAVCFVIGSELHEAGVSLPGLGGVVGLVIVAGSVYVWGPSAIIPATIIGVAAGAIVDAMVHLRSLRREEITFAKQVFGDSLDYGRVRLTNLTGLGGKAFTAPTLDASILVNIGDAYDAPTTAVFSNSYPVPGQVFIHELTHAWQIQHASLSDGFVPGLMCQGILNQTVISDPYDYGDAGQPWSSFNMEAQGAIVDQWFGGNGKQTAPGMNLDSPYFGYINDNLRLGVP
jgi:hypothetical protein